MHLESSYESDEVDDSQWLLDHGSRMFDGL